MTSEQQQKATETVMGLLEKGCADSEFTVALQHGKLFLDHNDGTIVLEVVGLWR